MVDLDSTGLEEDSSKLTIGSGSRTVLCDELGCLASNLKCRLGSVSWQKLSASEDKSYKMVASLFTEHTMPEETFMRGSNGSTTI